MTKQEINNLINKHLKLKGFWGFLVTIQGKDQLADALHKDLACKKFNVFGHDETGLPIIVTVCARHSVDAIKAARATHPKCRFNHTNLAK